MGREVRRVPADWQHPKHWVGGCHGIEERHKPLLPGERYQSEVDDWDGECAKWKAGWRPDHCSEDHRSMTYEQYAGQRPHRDDYMPVWPDEQRTHLMMYETTSEGTPISPAFRSPEELARWLVDNNARAFAGRPGNYDGWLRVARGGYAPTFVVSAAGLESGVDAI